MGLFHDKCTAIVDRSTGDALTGEALEAARALLYVADENGTPFQLQGKDAETVLATRGWGLCGHDVPKKARFCEWCGSGAPHGWVKCLACRKWIGNDARFCPHCNHPLHPNERVDIAGGVWDRDPGLFAQRFECGEDARQLKEGVMVQEGTVAILLDGGRKSHILGPGRHTPEGTLRAINWFGNPPPRSIVLVASGDMVFSVVFEGLRSAEEQPVTASADLTLRFAPGKAEAFLENFLKERRSVSAEEVCGWLMAEAQSVAKDMALQSTLEDLVKDPERRPRFEEALTRGLGDLLDRNGLELVRVGAVEFGGAAYEAIRKKYAELDQARRELEFKKANLALISEEEKVDLADTKARDERISADGKDRAEREAEDAEFHARKEEEVADYLAQLAQEKALTGIDRATEAQLALRVSSGKLARKDAELEAATRLERDARETETLAHKLGLDLQLKEYTRDSLLKDAEAAARVEAVKRAERENEARSRATIDGIGVEAWVKRVTAMGEGYQNYAQAVLAVQRAKQAAQREHLKGLVDIKAANAEIKANADRARANTVRGMSALELAALHEGDASAQAAFLAQAQTQTLAGLTKEQILAIQAGGSVSAAQAYAAGENAVAQAAVARANADAAAFQRERQLYDQRVKDATEQRDARIQLDQGVIQTVGSLAQQAINHGEKTTFMQAQTWPGEGPMPGGQSVGSAPRAGHASFGAGQQAQFSSGASAPVPPVAAPPAAPGAPAAPAAPGAPAAPVAPPAPPVPRQ